MELNTTTSKISYDEACVPVQEVNLTEKLELTIKEMVTIMEATVHLGSKLFGYTVSASDLIPTLESESIESKMRYIHQLSGQVAGMLVELERKI